MGARAFKPGWTSVAAALSRLDLGLLAMGYAVLLTLRNSYSEITRWPWCLLPQGLLLLGALQATVHCRRLGQPFDALVGLTVAALVVSAALSPDPERSWWYATMAGGYFALLYGFSGRWPRGVSLLGSVALAQVLVSVAGLYQYALLVVIPEWQAGPPFHFFNNVYPLGHHNFGSGLLSLTLPVTLALALARPGKGRWLWGLSGLLGLALLFSTQSRGGWLGALAGCVLVCGLLIRLDRRAWLALGAAAGVIFAVGALSLTFASTKSQLFLQGRDISAAQRWVFWQTGVRLWLDHPLFGVGQGVTGFLFPGYRSEIDPWMARTAQQLHSTPVHLLAETGLAGLAAYLGWLGGCALALGRLVSRERTAAVALAGALAGYAVSSLTDFQLENPAIALTLVLLAAELVRLSHPEPPPAVPGLRPLAVLLLAAVLSGWVRIDQGWQKADQAFALRRRGDIPAFIEAMRQAESLDPRQPYYPLQTAQALLFAARGLEEADPRRGQWIAVANRAAERAVRLLPTDPFTLTASGWLHYYRGELSQAAGRFREALRYDPTTTATLRLGLGLTLAAQGETEAALPHLKAELLLFPDQWTDDRWHTGALSALAPRLAREALAVYDRLLARYPAEHDALYLRSTLWLWLGRPDQALQSLNAMPATQTVQPDMPVALRLPWRVTAGRAAGLRVLALRQAGRREQAEEAIEALADSEPRTARCLSDTFARPPAQAKERYYVANGQDYFLLRRTGGPVLEFYEPLHLKSWAAMDCVTYGGDGRNWRLPTADWLPVQ
ncbi:O-antigen ligase family protein [Gloeobacter morelensis]|uniref:O-antigen ligase family protein n=1 Tax=Gloeobacter morelensis MG652769 TaxID=2781736 RepID=A0ABY3PL66_9CYAN|nr:O-antigen ligase family protein [Gloeobacter morelensis]UFP94415.1 O-antigen ligase family protein [Gloeobacter morelensis MG652769]